eukprot:gnl/TRDRNA2_/TRDRNA2_201985_c0_seq1.p1 gnl/TRDRNA2_/TRDRNA2_201985_c0~~gnl/TRDRNA2_/TRDRNA2_201985_c0_seq1.p1  ORF type:complete len:240 (-),score=24.40 gnl/TRDRNA2_/TRDRNA2_201985_c0_seq1:88-807(-)
MMQLNDEMMFLPRVSDGLDIATSSEGLFSNVSAHVLTKHLAPCLDAVTVANLHRVNAVCEQMSIRFVEHICTLQHGHRGNLSHSGNLLWSLRLCERMPTCAMLVFNESSIVDFHVGAGSPFRSTTVGSVAELLTIAQSPPSRGDWWERMFPLRRGLYRVRVCGGRNPFHGIFDLAIDGCKLPDGTDAYGATDFPVELQVWEGVAVSFSGLHILKGSVTRKNLNSRGYWACLSAIEFTIM